LLQVADSPLGARFRMLETVREFSVAQREAAGETDRVVGAYLAWARDFGVAHHESPFGEDPYSSLDRIRAEQDNLAQALRLALARADGGTVAATSAVLGGLWMIESNYSRLATMVRDSDRLLSHLRPGPDLVEPTRMALTLCTGVTFLAQGPRAVRSLIALRRLPPAPPDTLMRAAAIVLPAAAESRSALLELCDSDEPLVACAAGSIANYLFESEGDTDGALKSAERMLEALERRRILWTWALTHCRVAELCMQVGRGAEAQRHLRTALPVLERFGLWTDVAGIRWWMVLTNLQAGDVDEAERLLEQAAARADEPFGTDSYGLGVRAEILLARGEVEAGLRLWRRAVDLLRSAQEPIFGIGMDLDQDPWTLEARAVAVVAHARHGRLDLVSEVAEELPQWLSLILTDPVTRPFLVGFPLCGALLLALAMADLDRGGRAGDKGATRSGARMVALAERFRFLRNFQPTMSAAHARRAAEEADRSAYDDAVSSYADLGREGLVAAALAALRAR
jgi:tetratricopeptide (TPR) repeat protein